MRAFRISSYVEGADEGEPGHPTFVDRALQGSGRWDNPPLYATGYYSYSAEGAISEVYGGYSVWRPALFERDPRDRRLGMFDLPDDLRIADFDDPAVLTAFRMRVAEVAGRDPRRTQAVAAAVHAAGYDGIRWGSHYLPSLANLAVFEPGSAGVTCASVEQLSIEHPAVLAAAELIVRHVDRQPKRR